MSISKQIFFHVGTGKTGTTFLQYRVFPKLKGINYIQRTRYKQAKKIINNTTYNKYLISREFDQQLEHEVKLFAQDFPNTVPIIVFRRHDSYIASQYRRFVKNGFKGTFKDFFDLDNDAGFFKKSDLNYMQHINILKKYFTSSPIVLFYQDLMSDPHGFIHQIERLLDVTIDHNSLNLQKKHTSYSEQQLKTIQKAGKYINLEKRKIFHNFVGHLLWRIYLNSIRYSMLYLGKALPASFFDNKPLISAQELQAVKEYYEIDWKNCLSYSQKK